MNLHSRFMFGRRVTISLPIILSLFSMVNTTLGYLGIGMDVLDSLFGVSVGTIVLMYAMHYMFDLCRRHRIMIDYLLSNIIIYFLDSTIGIPLSNEWLLAVYSIVFGAFSFTYLISIFYEW